jgi:hypothetical protein
MPNIANKNRQVMKQLHYTPPKNTTLDVSDING